MRPIAVSVFFQIRRLVPLADLIQTGMIGLIKACDGFDRRRGSFTHFAQSKIRWTMIDSVRGQEFRELQAEERRPVEREDDGGTWNYQAFDRCDTEPLPDEVYEVHEALESLTRKQRVMVRLRLDGLTQKAAGAEMGISQAAARTLELRAYAALRGRSKAVGGPRRQLRQLPLAA